MEKIPEANLILTKRISFEIGNKLHDSLDWITIVDCMRDFAKLHVQAALEEASKKVKHLDYVTKAMIVDEDSILNCYPLENIK